MIKRTRGAVLVAGLCVWACVVAPCTSAESKAVRILDPAKEAEHRAGQSFTNRWVFDEDKPGALPKGWKAAQTGPGTLAKWQVVDAPYGGKANKAVALVETKNKGNTFNLLLAQGTQNTQDLCLQADFKVTGGEEDPGAGIVWRVQDVNNYYLCRYNAAEKNFRVYIVKDGKRKAIANANVQVPDLTAWLELEIKHNGSRILAELGEGDLIDVEDSTFPGPGMVGLYTKSDSTTIFDDVRLNVAKNPASAKKPDAPTASTPASGPVKIKFPGGRIALSSDGNLHDKDDFGGTAMALAMIKAAGLGDKVVHYDFSDHLGRNSDEQNAAMIESALGGADRFKLDKTRFFNDQTQMKEAIENFRKEGNKSSADNPLWYICAGPMEAPWRCVNAVDPDKRKFIHCISHSNWNETHGDTPEMAHKWDDIKALGVVIHRIKDQNSSNEEADFNSNTDNWHWLRDSANPDWQWLYKRNVKPTFDVSDAGMTFWLITGGPNGGVETAGSAETKSLLENPVKK